jgi:integrase
MARPAKPFPHRGWYKTNIGGVRHKLCRIEEGLDLAQEMLDRLKVQHHDNGGRAFPNLTVAEACALFLQHCEVDKKPGTFTHYKTKLKPFVERFGKKALRQVHLTDGVSFKKKLIDKGLENVTVNHHIRAAKTALNWAVDADYLPKNPWKKIKFLPEEGRHRTITDEEFQALLRHCTDALFRQILIALRCTAARPGELRGLVWSMVDFESHCWKIPAKATKTGSTAKQPKDRIIPMPPLVERLLRHRQRHGGVYVFPDVKGKQWKIDTFSQRFGRLRERAGIEEKDGETLVLYSNRHTRLTELSTKMPAQILQQVAGHTTFRMTQKYLHPDTDDLYRAVLDAEGK